MIPAYAELHALSNFSFQRGAAHAEELIERAVELGYTAIAITDECSLAGIVRALQAVELDAHRGRITLIVGAEFRFEDGLRLVLLAPDLRAYQQLSTLITRGRMAAPKGRYRLARDEAAELAPDCLALLIPDAATGPAEARWLRGAFRDAWLAVELHRDGRDLETLARLQSLAAAAGLRCLASGDVRYHVRARRALHDVMTALQLRRPVADCGSRLLANGERHLRSRAELATLYPEALLAESVAVAARCTFSLRELKYRYPRELVGDDTPTRRLRRLSLAGLRENWPQGAPFGVRRQIARELALIAELGYEPFFLTVHDIVREARARRILCQGRGSAANSAVCYVLGITAVNPAEHHLLFGRFISRERAEPPDIDVDFEHQRREEIIQYVFEKYGRARAAIAATVITYRSRSALRDVGRALGVAPEEIDRLAKSLAWWDRPDSLPERLRALGFDPGEPRLIRWMHLARALIGMPRHLSQHVGGFVISDGPLAELVPTETAAMDGRSIIQWDKDDLEALGLLKVDVLALGMLSAIRRTLELADHYAGIPRRDPNTAMRAIPHEDAQTYAMIQRGETLGVFQIESRAQMNMVTRLKPTQFYDLAVQVAIVRPGPIQGGMVHPYLHNRRLAGRGEPIEYPHGLAEVLRRTLGVPIFQEQVMEIAIRAAGFTPGEADQMRRSMASWKRSGGLEKFEQRLKSGMAARGYDAGFADRIYQQILGFGSYGFPESHAISFALLAYVSSWLKRHQPAAFFAGLLNAWPMGFYPPSMLVREAQRRGVVVRPIRIECSDWDCLLETTEPGGPPAIRLGLNQVGGLAAPTANRVLAARAVAAFRDVADLTARAQLSPRDIARLAEADTLADLAGHRHRARWAAAGARPPPGLLHRAGAAEELPPLPEPGEGAQISADYHSTGLTLRRHPLALLRRRLARENVVRASDLLGLPHRAPVKVAGMVMFRQRPQTATGLMFMTLEDETGVVNLIIPQALIEQEREALIGTAFVVAEGELQNRGAMPEADEPSTPSNVHVFLRHAEARDWLDRLPYLSRDFQ